MNLNSFLKNPKHDSVRSILIILIVLVVGAFVIVNSKPYKNKLLGLVNPGDVVSLDITIESYPNASTVEPGIYGVGLAKMYDEMAGEEGWLDTATDTIDDLSPTTLRYPAGGVVKYSHVFTQNMTQTLTEEEQASLVDVGFGPEIRGIGQIIEDRLDEEARGNEGELAEINEPKTKYNNLSYLEGFQNLMPRNFIHDVVDIANDTDSGLLYVINMRYASPLEIKDQVEYLIEQGVDIKGYEFDNEVYAKGGFYYQPGTPSVQAPIAVSEYLADADTYKEAILQVDPQAQFAVVAAPKKNFEEGGMGVEDTNSDFNSEWNIALASQMSSHGYNNYVVHFYHGFFPCIDEISSGTKEQIFSCGETELRYFNDEVSGPTDTTSVPPMLYAFYNQFSGKNLWLTEWNINQDPNRTDSKYANSILHAALTQQFLNILNTANATYGNFIKHATYHTFATDGGNAMLNKRSGKGMNIEADDINGFVRRTPYYAFMSMKEIFDGSYTPMKVSVLENGGTNYKESMTFYAYKDTSDKIAIAITNLSNKTIQINSITVDGETLDLSKSSGELYAINGDEIYSSNGSTEFGNNEGYEATIIEEEYESISNMYIPAYGVSTATINPEYSTGEPENEGENCNPILAIFNNCEEQNGIDSKKPKISIYSPEDKTFISGNSIEIQAYATDESGIEKIDFFIGQELVATDTSAPYKYMWNIQDISSGVYNIRATAYDTYGNLATEQVKVVKN